MDKLLPRNVGNDAQINLSRKKLLLTMMEISHTERGKIFVYGVKQVPTSVGLCGCLGGGLTQLDVPGQY